jgi:hypothetical protein
MLNEHIPFFERIRIEQQFDAFPGRQPAFRVLRRDTLFAAASTRRSPLFFQALQNLLHILPSPFRAFVISASSLSYCSREKLPQPWFFA